MAIPDFQSCMLPLLDACADGKEKSYKEIVPQLAALFKLSQEEEKSLLPSGRAPLFYNRVAWAKTYLQKAGLIEPVKRGVFKITKKGATTLKENPGQINIKYLMRFDEFNKTRGIANQISSIQKEEDIPESILEVNKTPDEQIAEGYKIIREELSSELLTQVKNSSWQFFERLVIDLLLAMGYGESRESSAKALGGSGDEGVDGVINEDKLGLDVIYIQAKKWSESVIGRPEIQKFVGALQGKRAKKGVFITTSSFTKDAVKYAANIDTRVILIDGERLANLMIDYDIGVAIKEKYEIKRMDSDYFIED
ncbi:MAG: restriction endonuclease [Nitrospinota bacterium]|nr:restriction endonuclease [Nitrospinota bacterium]